MVFRILRINSFQSIFSAFEKSCKSTSNTIERRERFLAPGFHKAAIVAVGALQEGRQAG
jgi:hypothetical protein